MQPQAQCIPPRMRRRASPLTRAIADAYDEATQQTGAAETRWAAVLGSSAGEIATMLQVLEQMSTEGQYVSPTRFVGSVHNAAAGQLSLATQNRCPSTSIAAHFDTPAMALVEGVSQVLFHDHPVVVACGDDASPEAFIPSTDSWPLFAAAVVLMPVARAMAAPRITLPTITAATLPLCEPATELHRNPSGGLLHLIRAVHLAQSGRVRLDAGRGRGFSTSIVWPDA